MFTFGQLSSGIRTMQPNNKMSQGMQDALAVTVSLLVI